MAIHRSDRLSKEIQKELSRVLQRESKDPRLAEVTTTRVELSSDLRDATVFFVPLGSVSDGERVKEIQGGLEASRGFLQGKLGRNLHLRFAPRLRFRFDRGVENLVRVHDLLTELRRHDEADGEEELS